MRALRLGDYFEIEPEVPGSLGPDTVHDRTVTPPRISQLHFVVHDWLGDCIVTADPVFLVVPDTAAKLVAAGFGGFRLADARVTAHEQFHIFNPGGRPPSLRWLLVHGEPGVDDVGLTEFDELVVSAAVLEVLRADGIGQATVTEWEPELLR